MKKLLFILVPFIVLIFSFTSKCATNDDIDKFKSMFRQKYNKECSTHFATQIIDHWQNLNNNNYYCYVSTFNGDIYQAYMQTTPLNIINGTVYTNDIYSSGMNYNATSGNMTWGSGSSYLNGANCLSLGKWSDFHVIPIEWENPYYSANIPAPVFEVYNAELNIVPIVDVPLSFDFQFVPSNAYVEVWADYSIPTKLNVVPQPNNGAQYRVLDYNVVSVNVLNKELLFESETINSSYMHVILSDGWDDVLDNLPITDVEFITQAGTQAWLDNRISEYEDLRKTNTLYGSAIKIKMRYFTIVDQTKFVVGPWRIWDSKNPETFTNELPTNYQVYLPANGTSGTNNDTSPSADIPVGSGTPTGVYYDPNVNITVTQNVPNYPDYPTIVSYNKDNLLVDTMNWADNLSSFFGEFGGFLTDSFAFIPGWIWAIIGFGFSLSIVVMFLKIL